MYKIKLSNLGKYLIFILAIVLRTIGIFWDQGFHLHPDERMILMVADSINFFTQLNPHFFNYGTLPIYILKFISQVFGLLNPSIPTYDGMLMIGRTLSILFDAITLILIYKITMKLFHQTTIALCALFCYSIAFFPIQNSHFFTVDTLLTMLVSTLIFLLLILLENYTISLLRLLKFSLILGIVFAGMMATKFSAIIFYPIIVIALLLVILRQKNKIILNQWFKYILPFVVFNLVFLIFHFLFMPYAFLDFHNYLKDISLQLKMNSDPYIFPYTLQYVDTTPYIYYLKNVFFWGLGPIISILSLIGLIFYCILFLKAAINQFHFTSIQQKKLKINIFPFLIFLLYYVFYFFVIGKTSVKFMRYMLPLYPFFAVLAGYGFFKITSLYSKIKHFQVISSALLMFISFVWTYMFVSIYFIPHTRISATNWILSHIPKSSHIAVEHWDDRLPLIESKEFQIHELPIYDLPDDENKWKLIQKSLDNSQYLIVASNRLYAPLQRLSECSKYFACYPKTAQYYQSLFSETLGFKKVAEFTAYPKIKIFNIEFQINDSSADESFTVYDHPKIIIFKKI